ncbi:MAG: hypothetical protein JKY96_05795 [Phycisphaerales bacterium]|nr:hypothetical protein [Phycisphaerales bacterium]
MSGYQIRFSPIALGIVKIVPLLALGAAGSQSFAQALPPVPFPAENPFTQEKSDLGKILFWDEQLSSDNTMSCGSCHQPTVGGTDERRGTNPGPDGIFLTADDIIGSPGVLFQTANDDYFDSDLFALLPQVTGRQAPPSIMAMYAPELFWDGRAGSTFFDPITGEELVSSGGALENQAVGPPASGAEMAHQDRNWSQIVDKMTGARPLALASNLPADMDAVLALGLTYPELFERAFGDDEVTAGRIGMAIATYERTLLPDQSPFDLFTAGNTNAMTVAQLAGLNSFRVSACNFCHSGSQFTDNFFHNIGVRPIAEDLGRFNVTNNPSDRGRFKTPSLRNTGLRDRYMHNGQQNTLGEVFDFYAHRNGQAPFPQNLSPFFQAPIAFNPATEANIIDFLVNGLTDPRVLTETFPFNRPTLYAELPAPNPIVTGAGTVGSSGFVPNMVAVCPPNLGNDGFKIGLNNALGGATATVALSTSAPIGGIVAQDNVLGPILLEGTGDGVGYGTMLWPISNNPALEGQTFYMQWLISDPNAAGGIARSAIAEFTPFCTMNGQCVNTCPADLAPPVDVLNLQDIFAYLALFNSQDADADLASPFGVFNLQDIFAYLASYNAGCP